MLIDFHTHCFPEKIALRAIEKLVDASGGFVPFTDGTVEGLKKSMKENFVDAAVVMNIATNPKQQTSVNDFAATINNNSTVFAFGSVHPDSKDAMYELERIKDLGLKGVKLHPDYQGFNADDEKMKPIYEKISALGLVTLFHAGFDYGFCPPYGATPEKLKTALKWFSSPVVAAHWGGINCGEGVIEHLCDIENLYFDTSFGYSMMPKCFAAKILEKRGAEHMLFGTDTPWHTSEMEWRLLDSLNISQNERELISHKNAEKLLHLQKNI